MNKTDQILIVDAQTTDDNKRAQNRDATRTTQEEEIKLSNEEFTDNKNLEDVDSAALNGGMAMEKIEAGNPDHSTTESGEVALQEKYEKLLKAQNKYKNEIDSLNETVIQQSDSLDELFKEFEKKTQEFNVENKELNELLSHSREVEARVRLRRIAFIRWVGAISDRGWDKNRGASETVKQPSQEDEG